MNEGAVRDGGSFKEVEVIHPSAHGSPLAESGWLSPERLGAARDSVPMVYVDAVPVRVNPVARWSRWACCCACCPTVR